MEEVHCFFSMFLNCSEKYFFTKLLEFVKCAPPNRSFFPETPHKNLPFYQNKCPERLQESKTKNNNMCIHCQSIIKGSKMDMKNRKWPVARRLTSPSAAVVIPCQAL